jgi:hypothetical protein
MPLVKDRAESSLKPLLLPFAGDDGCVYNDEERPFWSYRYMRQLPVNRDYYQDTKSAAWLLEVFARVANLAAAKKAGFQLVCLRIIRVMIEKMRQQQTWR